LISGGRPEGGGTSCMGVAVVIVSISISSRQELQQDRGHLTL